MKSMDIRKLQALLLISLVSFLYIIQLRCYSIDETPNIDNSIIKTDNELTQEMHTSEIILPDKVYTFISPEDSIIFESIFLHSHFDYEIYYELVTYVNCTVEVTVWDPDGKQYDIEYNEISWGDNNEDDEEQASVGLVFGTAMSGDYDIKFTIYSEDINLNLHIQITQNLKCLHDKMSQENAKNLRFFEVTLELDLFE